MGAGTERGFSCDSDDESFERADARTPPPALPCAHGGELKGLKPHHLPQRRVHFGLPARAHRAEAFEHFLVDAERDQLLGGVGPGAAAAGEGAGGGAEELGAVTDFGAGESLLVPFGRVIRIGPVGPRTGLVRAHCISSSK